MQKIFYNSIGDIMMTSKDPDLIAKGAKLKEDQDMVPTWGKKAYDAVTAYDNSKLPPTIGEATRYSVGEEFYTEAEFAKMGYNEEQISLIKNDPTTKIKKASPYKKDAISDLAGTVGELFPLLLTHTATPNPALFGVGMKLAVNFGTTAIGSTYSQTGDIGKSLVAGGMSVADAGAFMVLGRLGGKVSSKILSSHISSPLAPMVAAGGRGATMYWGGYGHSLASQIASGASLEDLDFEQAKEQGRTFLLLESPGILNAAMSTYYNSPRQLTAEARNIKAKVPAIRAEADKIMARAVKETDPTKHVPLVVAATSLHDFAEV